MIERNCWTVLAQRAQDQTALIQTQLAQILERIESLKSSKKRLQHLYEEYNQQEKSKNNLNGMREIMNQRQFMTQLLSLKDRVDGDLVLAERQLSDTRTRLINSERERMKMQSLADQNAQAVSQHAEKLDRKRMDDLGVMQFNLRDDSSP